MYIERIKLRDVRCFDEIAIDLSGERPGTSVLIAGNNGIGKSAVLRAIAMGLCDKDSASALLRELPGNFIRNRADHKRGADGKRSARIVIELRDASVRYQVTTTITQLAETGIDQVSQEYWIDGRSRRFGTFETFWDDLFVAGYGAGLRTSGTANYSDYFAPDALYSLFKYDVPLQDPEIAWRRLASVAPTDRSRTATNTSIRKLLAYVLDLEDSQITLEANGIFVRGEREVVPLDAIGDGHKSLAKMTLDILMWYLLKQNAHAAAMGDTRRWRPIKIDSNGRPHVRGVVIVDEIEQHLHPRLQRKILKRLSDKFPGLQFIATTHSPLCVSGTADVTSPANRPYAVFSLKRYEKTVGIERMEIPQGLRSDQILVDYFELPTTLNVSTEQYLDELRKLMSIPREQRTRKENARISRLLSIVRKFDFSLAENESDRQFQLRALSVLDRARS